MDKSRQGSRRNGSRRKPKDSEPSSVTLSQRGVHSSEDFRNLMCSLITDVIQGDVSPDVVNAACNAGRGLLRMVEMEYRASQGAANRNRSFPLSRRVAEVSAT